VQAFSDTARAFGDVGFGAAAAMHLEVLIGAVAKELLYLLEYLPHGFAGTDDLFKHRRAIDFLAQNEILVAESLFRFLLIVDIGGRRVPADNPAAVVL
jgi:hypothetical protein